MLDLVKDNVLKPLLTRVGMATTGWLVGIGANSQHADWVATGVLGAGLITFDLMLAWLRKKNIQRGAFNKALGVSQ